MRGVFSGTAEPFFSVPFMLDCVAVGEGGGESVDVGHGGER